jgi:hypothetical protein
MPPATRRLARANRLIRLFVDYKRFYGARRARRKAFLKRHRQPASPQPLLTASSPSELSSISGGSDGSQDAHSNLESSTGSVSSSSWLESISTSVSDFDAMDFDTRDDWDSDMHEDLEFEDGEQDMDFDSASGGSDGDDEQSSSGDDSGISRPFFQSFVRRNFQNMYANRYEAPRDQHPQGPSLMQFTLDQYKTFRPDLFRQDLRVSPDTFDKIVEKIAGHPVFSNNSNAPQFPVEEQLAITLFCFGHYGNAASLERVRKWAGTSKGLVKLATRRVMTALLSPDFMQDAVRLPTDDEKEQAKDWVEEHSCKAWRDGWCLVDGTLIPLYARPYWYGESYFDRKCNYSLNIQVSA